MTTGIFIRQFLGQKLGETGLWTASPDLLLVGPGAAFDESVFTDDVGYGWYFFQAPAIGTPNYLYLRGRNATSGSQTSRAYVYAAQSDQVLDPKLWQSSGFTVNGVVQNFVDFKALAKFQRLLAEYPLLWTPPTPSTSGATYRLIAWVDDSSSPAPPDFSTMAPFADEAALGAYVQAHPNMVFLDPRYGPAFLRQFAGQTILDDGTGALTSPDIVVSGPSALQDAAMLTSQSSYAAGNLGKAATYQQRNFVYVRAINTSAGPAKARVYLYAATTTDPTPMGWSTSSFSVAGSPCNWVDLTFAAAGEIAVSRVPIVWQVDQPPSGSDLILAAYVDGSAEPCPPDFTPFGYKTLAGVTKFVAAHPQLSWLRVSGATAARPSMSSDTQIVPGATPVDLYVGVDLGGVPTDGTLAISVPGPDATNTIVATGVRVPIPTGVLGWKVAFPANFATSCVIDYWEGATPVGPAHILAWVEPRLGGDRK